MFLRVLGDLAAEHDKKSGSCNQDDSLSEIFDLPSTQIGKILSRYSSGSKIIDEK